MYLVFPLLWVDLCHFHCFSFSSTLQDALAWMACLHCSDEHFLSILCKLTHKADLLFWLSRFVPLTCVTTGL